MTRLIPVLAGVAVAIALAVGGYLWLSEKQPQKYTGPVEKITFGSSTTHKIAAIFVAESKGYFEEEGIDIEVKEFGSGKASFLAMLKGEAVDISASADTPLVFESFKRADYYILAGIYTSYDDKVIARKDKGIDSIADLRGRRVGVTKGTSAHFFLDSLLTYHGIPSSEIKLVNIKPAELLTALEEGDVDAISAWEPIPLQTVQTLKDKAIKFPNERIYRKIFYLLVKKDFAKNHRETLRRFLKAIGKAIAFITENENESQTILAEKLKLDEKVVATAWQEGTFGLFLDQSLLVTLEEQARWAVRKRLTDATETPNYLDYIYTDALESVKPEAVTIIR